MTQPDWIETARELPPVLVIDIFPSWEEMIECAVCGREDFNQWGVPMSDSGYVVRPEFDGEWASKPVCRACHELYEIGFLYDFNMWGPRLDRSKHRPARL